MMTDETVKCNICKKDKKISEMAVGYVHNGKTVYVCEDCYNR